MKKKGIVLFPIETISRELDYKLRLGILLQKAGYRIVLAREDLIDKIAKKNKGGIYVGKNIFKTLFPTSLETYKKYKKNYWKILYLDEEGGIYRGDENDWEQVLLSRIKPEVLSKDDKILVWGEAQKEILLKHNPKAEIIVTGCPRFDYSHEKIIRSGKKYHILINMSYSLFNNHDGIKYSIDEKKFRNSPIAIKNLKFKDQWLKQGSEFMQMQELVHRLAEDKSLKIAIRPHPAEDNELYELLYSDLSNVDVINDKSAKDYLLESNVLIHNGCTTAIEAYFLGTPVIGFHGKTDGIKIPLSIGTNFSSFNEIIKFLSAPENIDNQGPIDSMPSRWVNNFKDPDVLNKIVEIIQKYKLKEVSLNYMGTLLYDAVRIFCYKILFSFIPNRGFALHQKKFPGFCKDDIVHKLKQDNIDYIFVGENMIIL